MFMLTFIKLFHKRIDKIKDPSVVYWLCLVEMVTEAPFVFIIFWYFYRWFISMT